MHQCQVLEAAQHILAVIHVRSPPYWPHTQACSYQGIHKCNHVFGLLWDVLECKIPKGLPLQAPEGALSLGNASARRRDRPMELSL